MSIRETIKDILIAFGGTLLIIISVLITWVLIILASGNK
jgi:hypothetical protein